MRARAAAIGLTLLFSSAGPVRASDISVVAWRGAVPLGAVAASIACTFHVVAGGGAALAAFSVDDDRLGLTEVSFTADITWAHAHVAPAVRFGSTGLDAPVIDVATTTETVSVRLTATWGGDFRTWPTTMRAACAARGATTAGTALVDGSPVPSEDAAHFVTVRATEFHGNAAGAVAGASLGGSLALDGDAALLGTFAAPAGQIRTTDPSGYVTESGPEHPWIQMTGSRPGPWLLESEWLAWTDPGFVVRAVIFDR